MTINLHGIKMKVLLHIAAWAILLGFPFYNSYRWNIPVEFVRGFYIIIIVNGIIFYGNYLALIPRFFMKNQHLKYYLTTILLSATLFVISAFTQNVLFKNDRARPPERSNRDTFERHEEHGRPSERRRSFFRLPFGPMSAYNFTFNAIVFTVFALGLKVLERHSEIEKRQKELEKEKLNSELAFLKNQISPHFFFNTLNNIYSLIGINIQDSQNAVLKLSKMMRYLLYESEQGKTKLSSEIEFMNNYIDLMRLRITDKVKLKVIFPEKFENITIPPLLFISIIENAFKHGISYREKSFIDIDMAITDELITFNCNNSIVTKSEVETSDINAGIGLENLRKRLALIFPERHEITIDKTSSKFQVSVKIHLI